MKPQSFRPKAEAMEGRDAPVILMTVIPLVPLLEIEGISFVVLRGPAPHQRGAGRFAGRGVSLTLDPDRPR